MSSVAIEIEIKDSATPLVERIAELGGDLTHANQMAADRIESVVRDHLIEISMTRHATAERLGAAPTGFWQFGAGAAESGITSNATGSSATVTITHPGISRAAHDVTITPTKGKFLAIPIHALSYGKKASEMRDFSGIETFIPRGTNVIAMKDPSDPKGFIPLYALKASVTLPQDRTLLPSDERLGDAAAKGVASYVQFFIHRGGGATS